MNRNTKSNMPRNDHNLVTLPKTTKEYLLNQESPFIPAKCTAKVGTTTLEYEKDIGRKQSIDIFKEKLIF